MPSERKVMTHDFQRQLDDMTERIRNKEYYTNHTCTQMCIKRLDIKLDAIIAFLEESENNYG